VALHSVNAEILMQAQGDGALFDILASNATNLVDGEGVRKALWLKYGVSVERISGSDYTAELCRLSAELGWRVFLLGGSEASNAGAAAYLRARFPGLGLARLSPPMERGSDGAPTQRISAGVGKAIVDALAAFRPHVVIACFGAPKQELWYAEHRDDLVACGARVWMSAGGTLDFLSGTARRAPRVVSRSGLEWLWRLLLEPRQRFARIARRLPRFALMATVEAAHHRLTARRRRRRAGRCTSPAPPAALPARRGRSAWYSAHGSRLLSLTLLAVSSPLVLLLLAGIALASWVAFGQLRRILFVQERVGRGGVPFRMLKFRTMRDAADPYSSWVADCGETRVTRLGRFLKDTHLDELPQVWNVLRGEMNLIGPRPEMLEVHDWAATHVPGFERRLVVRPGLTGWAQVTQGYTGQSAQDYAEKLRRDEDYIAAQRLGTDLRILVRTVWWMLRGDGKRWAQGDESQRAKRAADERRAA